MVGQCSYRSLVSGGISELRSENGFSLKHFARGAKCTDLAETSHTCIVISTVLEIG